MRIACVQVGSPPDEPLAERRDRVVALVRTVAADLVVLPELWPTGYFAFDRYAEEAESLDGPTITALAEVARDRGIHLMAGSFVERRPSGVTRSDQRRTLSNCAVLLDPRGQVALTYRKVHLFGYDSREAALLDAGTSADVATTALGRVGLSTCYDLRFPELYRVLVDGGAEIVIVPAAWPAARREHWRTLIRARAIENQVILVACNGVGTAGDVELGGHSAVVGPWGEVVAEAGSAEEVLVADVDQGQVATVRADFPVLTHRRFAVTATPRPPEAPPA